MNDLILARIEINKKAFVFNSNMYDESMCLTQNAIKEFKDFYGIDVPKHLIFNEVIDFLYNYQKQQNLDSVVMYFCKGWDN
jgi:hypothetical protein